MVFRCSVMILISLALLCPNHCSFAGGQVTDHPAAEIHSTSSAADPSQHHSEAKHESGDEHSSSDDHKNATSHGDHDNHGEHGEHGEHEEHADPEVLGVATIVILTGLVVMTLVFEKLKECALEKTSKLVKPVVQTMFGELTVLGFISLLVFIIDFHVTEETPSLLELAVKALLNMDHMSHALKELTEILHMTLFLVMILFLVQIGILLAVASKMAKKWESFEHQRDQVDQVSSDYLKAKASGNWLQSNKLRQELEYHSLRQAFIHPRIGAAFNEHSAPKAPPRVDDRFDFAAYLNLGLSHTLCEMVEVGLLGWLTLWVLTVFFWSFRYADILIADQRLGSFCPAITGFVLALSGYTLPAVLFVVSRKLNAAKKHLLPPRHQLYLEQSGDVEGGRLLRTIHADTGDRDNLDIPTYLQLPHAQPLGCCCCRKHRPTRHDRLFWFGAHGVEFLRLFFSVELLLCSAYWGVMGVGLFPEIVGTQDGACRIPTWSKVLVFSLSVPPPILVLVGLLDVMADFVLTSFVEEKRCRTKIKEVLMTMKTRTVVRMLKLINGMHHAALSTKLSSYVEEEEEAAGGSKLDGYLQEEEEVTPLQIARCPRGFVPLPGRHINWTDRCAGSTTKLKLQIESGEVLLPASPVYVRSGSLSEQEGTDVYFKLSQTSPRRVKGQDFQLQEAMEAYGNMFDAIDRDGSGSIEHAELATLLGELGFKNADRTIPVIINRLDSNNDGSIDKGEFLAFFKKQISLQTKETPHQMVHNIFNYLDSDNSGSISTAEFTQVISKLDNGSLTRDDVEEIVRMADENGDGEISLHELTTLVEDTIKAQIAL